MKGDGETETRSREEIEAAVAAARITAGKEAAAVRAQKARENDRIMATGQLGDCGCVGADNLMITVSPVGNTKHGTTLGVSWTCPLHHKSHRPNWRGYVAAVQLYALQNPAVKLAGLAARAAAGLPESLPQPVANGLPGCSPGCVGDDRSMSVAKQFNSVGECCLWVQWTCGHGEGISVSSSTQTGAPWAAYCATVQWWRTEYGKDLSPNTGIMLVGRATQAVAENNPAITAMFSQFNPAVSAGVGGGQGKRKGAVVQGVRRQPPPPPPPPSPPRVPSQKPPPPPPPGPPHKSGCLCLSCKKKVST